MAVRATCVTPDRLPISRPLIHLCAQVTQAPGMRMWTALGAISQPAADGEIEPPVLAGWVALSLSPCPECEVRSWMLAGPASPDICGGSRVS